MALRYEQLLGFATRMRTWPQIPALREPRHMRAAACSGFDGHHPTDSTDPTDPSDPVLADASPALRRAGRAL
jgi:hypothetical protein